MKIHQYLCLVSIILCSPRLSDASAIYIAAGALLAAIILIFIEK